MEREPRNIQERRKTQTNARGLEVIKIVLYT